MKRSLAPAICMLALGCGSGSEGDVPPDAAPDTTDAAGACPGPSATVAGVLKILQESGTFESFPPVVGGTVCVQDQPDVPCATTDGQGAYQLDCVPEGEAAIRYQHDDYASTMWLLSVAAGTRLEHNTVLVSDEMNTAYLAPTGVTYPAAGRGLITINETGHVDGATATVEGAGFEGPFYSATGQTIDVDATGTVGDGVIHFVAPVGTALVRVMDPDGAPCPHRTGRWMDAEGRLRVPVLDNTETSLYVRCP